MRVSAASSIFPSVRWGLVLLGVFLLGSCAFAELIFNRGDEDFLLDNDLFLPYSNENEKRLAVGDFNGNGVDDVAVVLREITSGSLGPAHVILLLDPSPVSTVFSHTRGIRIDLKGDGDTFLAMADLNGDGKKDLVIGGNNTNIYTSDQHVDVVLGRADPPDTLDLVIGMPDLRVLGKLNSWLGEELVTGDFNGDGAEDLLVGAPSAREFYLLEGGTSFPTGVIDLALEIPFPVFAQAGAYLVRAVRADFNRDGKDDIAMNGPLGANIIFGRETFPSLWTIGNPAPDVLVSSSTNVAPFAAGDVTGDGHDELFLYSQARRQFIVLDGKDVVSGRPVLDLSPASANTVTWFPVFTNTYYLYQTSILASMDFDGDGSKDIILKSGHGYLSSQLGTTDRLSQLTTPSFLWQVNLSGISGGTFNPDSKDDFVAYESYANNVYSPFGALKFLYGFKPLRNPSVGLRDRTPSGSRVILDLAVEGEPTEVFLSGDLAEGYRDRWIPFAASVPVDLSPEAGPKTVTAQFRNALGRKSEPISDNVTMATGESGQEAVNTILDPEPGSVVRIDCRLVGPGHVTAAIYRRDGRLIAQLMDADYQAGVWPVDWDGRTDQGARASAGIYVLIVTLNGQTEKHKVVVRG